MMTIVSNILLLGQPAQGQAGGSSLSMFVPLILIIVVFYFFMIRPQMKRQKELVKYRNELKKGDKVVTTGGIYGKIQEINEQTILLEVDTNVHMKIDKSAVLRDPSDVAVQQR
jgi:preprotein translocase subunit YajC